MSSQRLRWHWGRATKVGEIRAGGLVPPTAVVRPFRRSDGHGVHLHGFGVVVPPSFTLTPV